MGGEMNGDQAWRGQRVREGEPAWQRPWGLAVAMVRSWRAGGLRAENPPCRAVRGFTACGVGNRPSGRRSARGAAPQTCSESGRAILRPPAESAPSYAGEDHEALARGQQGNTRGQQGNR